MASDRIFGLVMAVVALAYIAAARQIQTSFLMDPVGPKTFPIIIGCIAALASMYLVFRPDEEPQWPGLRTLGALAIAVGVLVLYAYSLKPLGFLLPTAIAAALLSYQIAPRPRAAVVTGVCLSAALFGIFRYALGLGLVPWPRGLLG
jgi:putative tricarboxylic transport membrane protein